MLLVIKELKVVQKNVLQGAPVSTQANPSIVIINNVKRKIAKRSIVERKIVKNIIGRKWTKMQMV